jgi:transposase
MRKDIKEAMAILKKQGIKPNYTELGKRYGCDYRTVKRYFEQDPEVKITKKKKPSKLDDYKTTIEEKVIIPVSAKSIYEFIKKQGYDGKYTIVKDYCRSMKQEKQKEATIRFETNPGLQAQVDWKESMRLVSSHGEVFEINLFLMILGYSRYKYIELTLNRNQDTLFQAMVNGFKYYGGVPKEILFDNMRTVVDQSRTEYGKAVINSSFYEFSKDFSFEVIACRAFRPETKGKVENLAKVTERLRVYNNEFETLDELDEIIREFNYDLNHEISQATRETPLTRHQKEKEYLNPLPNTDILESFNTKPVTRKVSKESMIIYNKSKYSVSPKYVGKLVNLTINAKTLQIYYNKELIKTHEISEKPYHYDKEDMKAILKSDVFQYKSDTEIEKYIEQSMAIYDQL